MAHLDVGGKFFLDNGFEHAFHSFLNVLDSVVDDGVLSDFHAVAVGQFLSLLRGTHLETYNHGIGSGSQRHVVFADLAHALVNHLHHDILRREFDERVGECFHRAVHIGLDDDIEFVVRAHFEALANLFEREHLSRAEVLLALQLFAAVGNLACLLLRFHHVELVAGLRCAVEAEQRGGHGGPHFVHALVTLVEECLHAAEVRTGQHHVALLERTVAHKHRGHVAAPLVERRLDDRARSLAVGVGFEFEHVGLEQHLLQKVGNADALFGGDVLALILAAPFFHEEVHGSQSLLNLVGVGVGLIYLVDGEDDGHVGSHGVADGFLRLRHDVVVGGDDDDGDVRHLCAAGTHGGKGFVTRGVEEGDVAAALERHVVRADVLRDAASFAGDDVRLADIVEQGGLTVVHVTHHRNDRGAGLEVFLVVGLLGNGFLHVGADKFGLKAELFGHEVDGLGVHALVDAHHDADAHARADDLRHRHLHHVGQFVGGYKLRELEYLALGLGFETFFFLLGTRLFTLFFAELGTLVALLLISEACQCFLHLLGYVLFRHFGLHLLSLAVALALLLAAFLAGCGGGGFLALAFAVAVVAGCGCLVGSGVHVHAFLADALAFLLLAGSLSVLGFTLFAALFLRLLLGTRGGVDAAQVDGSEHLGRSDFSLRVQFEHAVALFAYGLCALFHRGARLALLVLLGGLVRLRLRLLCGLGWRFLGFRLLGGGGGRLFCLLFLSGRLLGGFRLFGLLRGWGCLLSGRFGLGCRFFLGGRLRFAAEMVEVNLALGHNLRFHLFGHSGFHHLRLGLLLFRGRTLVLLAVLQQFFGLVAQHLVCAELLFEQFVLLVVNLFAGHSVDFVAFLTEEIDNRLQTDVEFFNCFV